MAERITPLPGNTRPPVGAAPNRTGLITRRVAMKSLRDRLLLLPISRAQHGASLARSRL